MPNINRYKDIFYKTLYLAILEFILIVSKLEPSDNPLPSMELNRPIPLSVDNEIEDNSITLCNYTS